ncbi:hypothetical protein [Nocardia sp. NPDC020380]|uniref:hypothetical protein n=1 Tax=Nocardia sp. NPDC020380 TaxID=3364309 RepID=UPI0037B2D680
MQNLVTRVLPATCSLIAIAAAAATASATPPGNAQQAQDVCIGYLLQTIRAMPDGIYLAAPPDNSGPPGSVLQQGTGSGAGIFHLPESYSIAYRVQGSSPWAAFSDTESAWQAIGWPTDPQPPDSKGIAITYASPADGYQLSILHSLATTLSCDTTGTFPGGGPAPIPAPDTLGQ